MFVDKTMIVSEIFEFLTLLYIGFSLQEYVYDYELLISMIKIVSDPDSNLYENSASFELSDRRENDRPNSG